MSQTPGGGSGAAEPAAFAFFSLNGDRFNAPGMPAESAREVGYFRDAVWEAARLIWLERNPDRSRIPTGFEASFDLRLIDVARGSARPRLVLHRHRRGVSDATWDEWQSIFAAARDRVTKSIDYVASTDAVPAGLTTRESQSLRRLGASLQEGESIRVGHPTNSHRRATLDVETRRVLQTIAEIFPTGSVEVELEGVVIEYDGTGLSFQLRTHSGVATCVLERFNDQLARFVRDVLALDGITAPDVRVAGETLDQNRPNPRLFNVHAVSLVRSIEEKALALKVLELSALEDGWWGPASLAPAPDVLAKLELVLEDLSALGIPVDLIPAGDGSVVVELRREKLDLSAVIEPSDQMHLIIDNTDTDELQESQLPWNVNAFRDFLRRGRLG